LVGQRHPVGIAGQVGQDLLGAAERRLAEKGATRKIGSSPKRCLTKGSGGRPNLLRGAKVLQRRGLLLLLAIQAPNLVSELASRVSCKAGRPGCCAFFSLFWRLWRLSCALGKGH
jgi:hypothetical protein